MAETRTMPWTLSVADGNLTASILFTPRVPIDGITSDDVLGGLQNAGIKVTPGLEKRAAELTTLLASGRTPSEPVVVARGKPPFPGRDGFFEPTSLVSSGNATQADHANFYEQNRIVTVNSGDPIGTLHAPEPPRTGEDVYGAVIPASAHLKEARLGRNVHLGDDGTTVIATCGGLVRHDPLSVSVEDIVELHGDVDFNSGNIHSTSDVLVRGSVLDCFSVESRKSVEIGGNIQAADVKADQNITVRGGICGKDRGKVTCGGELEARFCSSIHIASTGNVRIAKEAINCTIQTQGFLDIRRGSLIGGRTHARNGAEIATLGSEAGIKTHIGVGMDPGVYPSIAALEARIREIRETALEIRSHVQPLLANLKRLTPAQREKATELMFKADSLESQTEPLTREKDQLIREATPVDGASLLVSALIHGGLTVTVDNFEVRFDKELKGPVKIEKRKIGNVTEVVLVNQISGSITILPARKLEPPDPLPVKRQAAQ
jgi:uncharacterized protein